VGVLTNYPPPRRKLFGGCFLLGSHKTPERACSGTATSQALFYFSQLNIQTMNRRFEGIWIPAEIWLAYQVDLKLRILVSEIKSLDSGPAGCVASNEYFAKQLNCDKTTVSKLITKAVKNKWISREMTYKPGSKEVQTRHLRFIEFHGVTQGKTPQELRAQNTGFDWKTPLHLCKTPLASMQDPLALVQGYNTLSIIEVLSIYNKELLNLQE